MNESNTLPSFKIRCRGVIMHEGKLLLMRHVRSTGPADYLSLPGGHLDFGEDPRDCMRRELMEELGIDAEVGRLLFVHTLVRDEDTHATEFFFEITNAADFLHHAERVKSHAHEIAEVRWVSPDEDVVLFPPVFADLFRSGEVEGDTVRFIP